jgi:hypothetical protein
MSVATAGPATPPTTAPPNLSPVVEHAATLSAAKAIVTVHVDMLRFFALGRIAGRLDAAELRELAAARGPAAARSWSRMRRFLMRAGLLQARLYATNQRRR